MGRFMVPFGTEPTDYQTTKGVIIVYDTFDSSDDEIIEKVVRLAEERDFDKVVLYPLHEKTSRRMDIDISLGYKQRIKKLEDGILQLQSDVQVEICKLEGKRSKYTPIDFALSFLTEHNNGPYFVWMSDTIANKFATFSTFDRWIREVRLMIYKKDNEILHPKLTDKKKRWEWV